MSRIQLSQAAAEDIREVRRYTLKRFGPLQAVRIREQFQAAFQSLVKAPLAGHLREEYDPPSKTFRYRVVLRSFVIVYESIGNGIRVARVLHGARNLTVELERESGGA